MIHVRISGVEKVITLSVVLCVAFAGMPPLLAAEPERLPRNGGGVSKLVDLLSAKGESVDLDKPRWEGGTSRLRPVPQIDHEEVRKEIMALQTSAHPQLVHVANRVRLWLDIATETDPVVRHQKIRQLPVTVTTSSHTQGRSGRMKSFVAGGKTRVRWFIPDVADQPFDESTHAGAPSGPAAFDECYEGGEPSPCATEQEIEDLLIQAAAAQEEADYLQQEFDTSYAEYEAYCNDNPWNCEGGENQASVISGPAECMPGCGQQAVNAAGNILVFAGTTVSAVSAAGAVGAAAMTTAAAVGWGALIAGTGLLAGYATITWLQCKLARTADPAFASLQPFEPVY